MSANRASSSTTTTSNAEDDQMSINEIMDDFFEKHIPNSDDPNCASNRNMILQKSK